MSGEAKTPGAPARRAGAGDVTAAKPAGADTAIAAALEGFGFPVAVVLSGGGEELGRWGEVERDFPFASVTKPLVAWSALVAVERGMLSLESPVARELLAQTLAAGGPGPLAGVGSHWPPAEAADAAVAGTPAPVGIGAAGISTDDTAPLLPATLPTLEQLLSHSSGLASDAPTFITEPGRRRIYSNAGFEVLSRVLKEATGFEAAEWLEISVLEPLGMTSVLLEGSPAHGTSGNAQDLSSFAQELAAPALISPALAARAQRVVGPELAGILPGYGRQKPNGFGLGVEVRGNKAPHWTGSAHSPATFGHFGQSGSFVWVDPVASRQAVFLGAERFGPRHQELWPTLNDALLAY